VAVASVSVGAGRVGRGRGGSEFGSGSVDIVRSGIGKGRESRSMLSRISA